MIVKKIGRIIYNLQKKFPLLKHVGIELTRQCNLNCVHCYMNSTNIKDKNELSFEEICKIADEIYKINKKAYIQFTGGEAMMRDDFLEILKYFNSLGFRCYLVSNGVLLTNKKFEEIKPYLIGINISIDGLREYHNKFRGGNSFDIIIENIKNIDYDYLNKITIKTVITKDNINDIEKIKDLIISLGIKNWHIIELSSLGRGKNLDNLLDNDDYIKLEKFVNNEKNIKIVYDNPFQKSNKQCMCGIDIFCILYNGDIIGCLNADREKVKIYGNIRIDSINDLWYNSFGEFRNKKFINCN